jgi:hypothetical protein
VPAKREILKLLFDDIRIGKTTHTLSRWSTAKDRLTAATARIKVSWRKPGTPIAIPRQREPQPVGGGARAQRRSQTSIELAAASHSDLAEAS